jgi:3-isopropylmalate/(R)-2-methylmalate dehydratase small subunit
MEPFRKLTGIALPFDEANVDTNQLCPTRFNKVPIDDPTYPTILFHDRRFHPDGSEKPDFILNREPYREAKIIVADRNWGGGSSRESAVYALMAFGIRSVIASGFGDIHFNNSLKNGLLPVRLPGETVVHLRAQLHDDPGSEISVDLESQTVTGPDGAEYFFDIPPISKKCLLLGLDDIGRTQNHNDEIGEFKKRYFEEVSFLP